MQGQAIIKSNYFNRKTVLLIAAFAAVYIFWGSTYLAIKYAIETLPSFLMAGSRFLIAGGILYIWGRFSADYEKPTFAQWRTSFIVGALLLLGGNGAMVVAQHYIPSSMAALLVATEPFYIVLLSWLWLGNNRPNMRAVLGLLVGFFGVFLLINGQGGVGAGQIGSGQIIGTLLVIGGAFAWAAGSIYGLRAPAPKSSALGAGMQMLSGGALLTILGTVSGEWSGFNIAAVSTNSWLGWIYLIIFGSLIGFTAYSWLLKNAPPAKVSTYAYVNPVIAVLLGWMIAGETFTGQMLLGAGIIVSSVMLITSEDKNEPDSRTADDAHESQTPQGDYRSLSASA
jgi:drug/metabolite transporter (DMT)-like permease